VTLTESLNELVDEHDRIGSPLRSRLGPGLPRGKVEAALHDLGLAAPDEVLELYAWHEIRDAPSDRSRVEWFWPAAPLRLEEAIRTYREVIQVGEGALSRAQFDELVRTRDPRDSFTGFWRTDWFPILYASPENYAVECGPGSEGATEAPVWRASWHPDTGFPNMQLAPSLTAFVTRVVELFRLGGYEWNEEYQAVSTIDEVFERQGLGSDVRPWPSMP
jgi:cell wall assembly regulator SMI1